jgi:tetratricopeptide (TPR) repeat protein
MYSRAIDLSGDHYLILGHLALAYDMCPGQNDKAEQGFRKAAVLAETELDRNPDDPAVMTALAEYRVALGDTAEAKGLLGRASGSDPNDPVVMLKLGEVYEQIGERDEALRWIEMALDGGAPLYKVSHSPDLSSLRADPRYRRLLEQQAED